MEYVELGNPKGPVLVCIPGLMGGPEDFAGMLDAWTPWAHIFIPDPNAERRRREGVNLTVETMKSVSYDSTAVEIAELLKSHHIKEAFIIGFSIGGKVVYDFASKFPKMFLGGLVTDVGPGSFENSTLFKTCYDVVKNLNLNADWETLKKELRDRVKIRSLRSLMQTQLYYPNSQAPAEWKAGMRNFLTLLNRQQINNQFEELKIVDAEFFAKNRFIDVLQSEECSGIDELSEAQLKSLSCVRLHRITQSSHFLHVSHKEEIKAKVIGLIKPNV